MAQVAEHLSSKCKVLNSNPRTTKTKKVYCKLVCHVLPAAAPHILCFSVSCLHQEPQEAGGVAQVVEYLSSKCEALSSNTSTTKKKKKRHHRE
jgi:hypothetical protein